MIMEKACEAQVFESNQALHKAMHDDTHGSYIGVPREGESGLSEDSWDSEENDLPKRQQWSGQLDFMLSCIGYAVGLGNVWRFPYLCYVNGGGVFLIPYVLMVVISGMPCFVMEVALGQFMRKGGIAMWGIAPLFRGVGFSSVVVVFFSNIYYVVILAWSIYFLVHCFNMGELPWASCGHKWNTPACQEHIQCVNVSSAVGALSNATNGTCGHLNGSVSPVVEFWERNVLRVSSGLEDTGSLSWGLVLCMIAAWILIYLCLWKGIRSTEKVVYFTATFPYIMLFALFVRSMMLDGAYNGIMYYLKPDWAKLTHPKVWVDACTQVFLSYGLGYASIATLGSFNSFHTNCYRNSIILAIINSGTSVFAGFLVFAVLGFMAQEQGVAISAVAQSGPGLAFIAYPQAVALMPLSQLWATLFFFMLILLGLDTQFVGVEAFITAVTDVFPEFLRGKGRREIFLAVCCVLKLLLGLYMVTEGGIYLFQLIDLFAVSGVTLLWQVFWQCIVVAWVYGGENFMADVTLMIGYRPNSIIKWSLAVVTPAMCMGMFLFTLLKHESVKYKEYVYPPWGEAIGWLMALSSMLCMPCTLLFLLLRSKKGNLVQRWKHLSMPVFESHVEFYRQGLDEVHDCPRDLECNAVSASHSIIPHSATHSPISSFCRRGKKLSRSSLRMCDRDKFRAKVLLNSRNHGRELFRVTLHNTAHFQLLKTIINLYLP